MSKKTNPVESKAKKTPKKPTTPPVTVAETEEVIIPTGGVTAKDLAGSTGGKLSPDGRVHLLQLADDIFRKDPNAERRFGIELTESVNHIVAAGVLSSMVDEALYGDSSFTAVLRGSVYPQLVLVAHDMGIKLPDIKALPVNENGEVELPSTQIGVTAETKKKVKEEHEIQTKGNAGEIELDPVKVAKLDEEALKNALSYLLITGSKQQKNVKDYLTTCVDFMRAYRMAKADSAEKPAQVKDELDSRSTYEWLMDVFSYIKPTHIASGIGTGMKWLIQDEHCGVSAFLILRKSLTDSNTGEVCWDDQSIADAARAIVEWKCTDIIKGERAKIEALDKKSPNYKENLKGLEDSIAAFEKVLYEMSNPSFEMIDMLPDLVESGNETACKMAGRIRLAYYPETKDAPSSNYKNLRENLRQRAGIIANMFRDPGTINQEYSVANLTDLVEYTDEEKEELRKEEAKKKKEESKNV